MIIHYEDLRYAWENFLDFFGLFFTIIGSWLLVFICISSMVIEYFAILLLPMLLLFIVEADLAAIVSGFLFSFISFICITCICIISNYSLKKIHHYVFYGLIIYCNIFCFICIFHLSVYLCEYILFLLFFMHLLNEVIIFYLLKSSNEMGGDDVKCEKKCQFLSNSISSNRRESSVMYFKDFKTHENNESVAIAKKISEVKNLVKSMQLTGGQKGFLFKLLNDSNYLEDLMQDMEISGLSEKDFKLLAAVKNSSLSSNANFLQEFTYQSNHMRDGTLNRKEISNLIESHKSFEKLSEEEKAVLNFYNAAGIMLKWHDGDDYADFSWQDIANYCTDILRTGNINQTASEIQNSYKPIVFKFSDNYNSYRTGSFVWCALVFVSLMSEQVDKDYDIRKFVLILNILLCYSRYLPVIIKNKERQEFMDAIENAKDGDCAPFIQFLFRKECKLQQDSIY